MKHIKPGTTPGTNRVKYLIESTLKNKNNWDLFRTYTLLDTAVKDLVDYRMKLPHQQFRLVRCEMQVID
jgi:hypothetical protein